METTMEDTLLDFSGFTEGDIELTNPMKLTAKLDYKRLTLLAGENDSGKSLTNKLIWASTFFFNMKLIQHVTGLTEDKSDEEVFKYILDNTFDDQKFNGSIVYSTREDLLKVAFYKIRFNLVNGEVTDLFVDFPIDAQPMGSIIYLSKEARDFSNIEKYLKIKKMIGVDEIDTWESLEKLGEFNKLYDIISIESLLVKFQDVKPLLKLISQSGGDELLGDDLVDIEFDKNKSELYYTTSTNEKKRLSTLGAGTQSIIFILQH